MSSTRLKSVGYEALDKAMNRSFDAGTSVVYCIQVGHAAPLSLARVRLPQHTWAPCPYPFNRDGNGETKLRNLCICQPCAASLWHGIYAFWLHVKADCRSCLACSWCINGSHALRAYPCHSRPTSPQFRRPALAILETNERLSNHFHLCQEQVTIFARLLSDHLGFADGTAHEYDVKSN